MSLTLTKTVCAEHVNRMIKPKLTVMAALVAASFSSQAEVELGGSTLFEGRYFLQDAAYPGQPRTQASIAIEPEAYT